MSDVKNYSSQLQHAKGVLNKSGAWTWDLARHSIWWSYRLSNYVLDHIDLSHGFSALLEVTHEDDRPILEKHLKELGDHGKTFQLIIRIFKKNTTRFLLINAETAEYAEKRPTLAIGNMVDVTHELVQHPAQEELLNQTSPGGNFGTIELLSINHSTAEVAWSDSLFTLLGYSGREFVPTREHVFALFHPTDVEKILSDIPCSFEARIKTRHGNYKWFLVTLKFTVELDSLITRKTFIFTDIDYLKRYEVCLTDNIHELTELINAAGNLAVVVDETGDVIFYNRAVHEWFAPVRKRLSYPAWVRLFCGDPDPGLFRKLQIAFRRNSIREKYTETALADKHGKCRQIGWYNTLIFYKGKPAILCSGIDLSARKLQVDELSAHNKKLKEFAHMASHNLRGPVNNSLALINLYKHSSKQADKDLFVEKLEGVTHKLLSTLDEFSLMIRDSENANRKEEVYFRDVLKGTIILFSEIISETQTQIQADFKQCESVVYKRFILESVFQNLISNSIKYRSILTPPEIQIRSEQKNDHCVLIFKDNGSGIDLQKHGDQVFGLYNTFHENSDAQGVGLYLIRSQIEDLGGRITVKSSPGEGCEFRITL